MANIPIISPLSKSRINALRHSFGNREVVRFVYLGKDYLFRRSLTDNLGERFQEVSICRLLDQVAEEIRVEHVRWIDALNKRCALNIDWWFGAIASRNIYESNLFGFSCYLEVVKRLLDDPNRAPQLIIVESHGLAVSIQKLALGKDAGIIIAVTGRSQVFGHFFNQWLVSMLSLIMRRFAVLVSGRNSVSLKGDCIIVNTFIRHSDLSSDGRFHDRYFPGLYEHLQKKGKKVLLHAIPLGKKYNYFSFYRKLRISGLPFLLPEDHLSIADYSFAFLYPLRLLFSKIEPDLFFNMDLSDITKEDKLRGVSSGIFACLLYRFFLKLNKIGLNPETVIDWYENQGISKALVAAFNHHLPSTKLIGAQMFIPAQNIICLFPSQSEVEAGLVPDILLETGHYQCESVKAFSRQINSKTAAALRYSYVFNGDSSIRKLGKDPAILILLSYDLEGAVELLESCIQVAGQINHSARIILKCHANYDYPVLCRVAGRKSLPKRFEIFTGELKDAFLEANVVICSGTGSMVEAVAKGIPVVFLSRQTVLNQNALAGVKTAMVAECFSAEELAKAVARYLSATKEEQGFFSREGARIRDLFFTPVNDETLDHFCVNSS